MVGVVVLLGAPGSGKSTVGAALGRLGLRWREWEPIMLAHWGSRERFLAHKGEALPALHDEILAWIAADPVPAVLETTGLSDAPLLARLTDSGGAFVVRLDASEDDARRRIAARSRGEHLTDEIDPGLAVWHAFYERVAAVRPVDLVVDTGTTSAEAVAATILAALADAAPAS
jgi:shikimate kinase